MILSKVYEDAERRLERNEITLGEFERLVDIEVIDPKRGEWIEYDEERDYCSRCKHIFKTRTITKQDKWTNYIDDLGYNYCPNCGCRMKGADDE